MSASPAATPEPAPPAPRSAIIMRPQEPTGANAYSQEHNSNARKMDALKKNPLVPAGAITTGMVLLAGLFAFKTGNPLLSQRLMRARVIAQGATLSVLAASVGGNLLPAKAEAAPGVHRR